MHYPRTAWLPCARQTSQLLLQKFTSPWWCNIAWVCKCTNAPSKINLETLEILQDGYFGRYIVSFRETNLLGLFILFVDLPKIYACVKLISKAESTTEVVHLFKYTVYLSSLCRIKYTIMNFVKWQSHYIQIIKT